MDRDGRGRQDWSVTPQKSSIRIRVLHEKDQALSADAEDVLLGEDWAPTRTSYTDIYLTTGTIGITDYAAHALGDVVFVELPTIDLEVTAGDSIGAVESVKSASDILTPVSGVIVEANSALEHKPANINKDPTGEGWLAKIKISDKAELEGLMDEAAYKAFTEESSE